MQTLLEPWELTMESDKFSDISMNKISLGCIGFIVRYE